MRFFKYLFLPIIIYSCTTSIKRAPPLTSYQKKIKEIARSLSKEIKKGKKVVVMNFIPFQKEWGKGVSALNIYLARLLSSYLSEFAKDKFYVIDREKGEKIVKEDLKFEVNKENTEYWKNILEKFQCDYYIIGEYNLSISGELELIDISLMEGTKMEQGPKKVKSESMNIPLSEIEYEKLRNLAFSNLKEQFIYEGESSLREDKKGAYREAYVDAINKFKQKIFGISIGDETMWEEKSIGDTSIISYVSTIQSRSFPINIRLEKIGEYYKEEKGKYKGYVRIYIPEKEISKVRRELEEYKNALQREMEEKLKIAESEGNYRRALFYYEHILDLAREFPDISPQIKSRARAKRDIIIKSHSDDPVIKLLYKLSYTQKYFHQVKLVKGRNNKEVHRSKNSYYVDLGDTVQLYIKVGRPLYIYILSYWQQESEVRLLYPNRFEPEEKIINGSMIFPERTGFVAERDPRSNYPELNYFFVIVTPFKMNLEENINYRERNPYILSKEELSWFLDALDKRIDYDVKKIKVFIKR